MKKVVMLFRCYFRLEDGVIGDYGNIILPTIFWEDGVININ